MKANELRIGNWVKFGKTRVIKKEYHGEHIQLNIDNIHFIANYPDTKNYEPIELSPEILEKCGFDFYNNKYYKSFVREGDELLSQVFVARLDEDPEGMYYYGFSSPLSSVNINNIYHLHQLQNLYYALTGQELNYKP